MTRLALCRGVRMYSQIDAATRPKANPETPATKAPAKVAKRRGVGEVRRSTRPCARSIRKRAALAWVHHFTGRLRNPRGNHMASPDERQREYN
jgi:hypothetical protein